METLKKLMVLLAITFFLTSFKGDEVKPFKNGKDWIPADFDTRKSVLMVQYFMDEAKDFNKPTKKVNTDMQEYMKQVYRYKYEFVSINMLKDSKFDDKDTYRYVLMSDNSTSIRDINPGVGQNSFANALNKFHIYDRKLDKHYPDTKYGNSYVMPVFKQTLATIFLHFQNLK